MNTFLESVVTNDVMALFLLFIAALPAILCIVLFFKVWGMTNDVSKIKDLLKEQLDLEHPYVDTSEKSQQGPASAQ